MIKLVGAVVAAALVATIFTIAVTLPVVAPEVSANTTEQPGAQQPAVKGDRLAIRPIGAACSPRAWPYYDRDCLFESRWPGQGEARKVRIVSTDKLDGEPR